MKSIWSRLVVYFNRPTLLGAIITGFLLGIGFVFPLLWWCGVLGILWAIRVVRITPLTRLWWWMGLAFTFKSLLALLWFWSAYPIEWVGLFSPLVQVSIIFLYWLTAGLWLGAGGLIFAGLARVSFISSFYPRFLWYLSLPFFWLGSELAGSYFFSIVTIGPGSLLQSYFSFGWVGYLLGTIPLGIWLASPAAVYGLTVFIVLLAVGTEAISRAGFLQKWLVPVYAGGLLIGISFISFPIHTSIQNESTTRVISITTQFNSSLLATTEGAQKKAEILAIAVNQATKRNPDFILLPEDSRYLESLTQNQNPIQAMQFFQFTHAGTGSILIDSGRLELPTGETVLRASIFDGHSKLLYQFDKQYLVPQGEYVPTLYGAFMSGLGYGNLIRAIARDSAYRPGPLKQAPVIPEYIPGILFCFESVRPNGVAALMARRPLPFIAHPISHGWFHSSEILRQQLDVMLRIQARQSGLPIVSAGNMASSKLYTPQGEIERGSIVGSGESFELSEFIF